MPDTYIKFDGVDGESYETSDTINFTGLEDDGSTTSRDGGGPFGGTGNDVLLGDHDPVEGQDGNDLLIVNNGDGSDFYGTGFTGGVYVAAGDFSGDTVVIDDMAIL